MYDLNQPIDRHGTNCLKFDFASRFGIPEENLSLWVADMDFPAPEGVIRKLSEMVSFGIFGYADIGPGYFEALQSWYSRHFGWNLEQEWLSCTPGVVFALAACVRAFTRPGEKVVIQTPVYRPFYRVVDFNDRQLVKSPLRLVDGHYEMDFADLEEKLKDPEVKMMILCSPHNPVGRVWKKEELEQVAELCLKNGVILVSDEIHADFVWPGHKHIPVASLSPEIAGITVTCTAPSKTFNLAGLQISNILIPNENLRNAFKLAVSQTGLSDSNQMGLAACQAAYETGEEWLTNVLSYIWDNIGFVRSYLAENLPQIHLIEPEGTYLVWLDFRELNLSQEQMDDLIIHKAGLWLDDGGIFGKEGAGFQRINTACSRSYLKQALDRLAKAVKSL